MNSTFAKVFIASALGSFVGALVALQLNINIWWIGMLVGGFVGYISFEIRTVIISISIAWNRTTKWRPHKEWWVLLMWDFLFLQGVTLTILIPINGITWYLSGTTTETDVKGIWYAGAGIFGVMFFVDIIARWSSNNLVDPADDQKILKEMFLKTNPVSFYFYHLPRFVLWCLYLSVQNVARLPCLVRTFCRLNIQFFWHFFKLIHSDVRLLCALDAALGAGLGYVTGNAFIGGLLGGVLGVLNFEFVSRRWFKLVPEPTAN